MSTHGWGGVVYAPDEAVGPIISGWVEPVVLVLALAVRGVRVGTGPRGLFIVAGSTEWCWFIVERDVKGGRS